MHLLAATPGQIDDGSEAIDLGSIQALAQTRNETGGGAPGNQPSTLPAHQNDAARCHDRRILRG